MSSHSKQEKKRAKLARRLQKFVAEQKRLGTFRRA